MTQVVLLKHGGVACALPAAQVVGGLGADVPAITLFATDESSPRRELVVQTPGGHRRVLCSEARFDELDPDTMMPMPELLGNRLKLPHVVGLADTRGELRWLVDLTRWEDG